MGVDPVWPAAVKSISSRLRWEKRELKEKKDRGVVTDLEAETETGEIEAEVEIGTGIIEGGQDPGIEIAKRHLKGGSLPCTGMCPHLGLSTLRPCSTRACSRVVKSLQH